MNRRFETALHRLIVRLDKAMAESDYKKAYLGQKKAWKTKKAGEANDGR